MKSLVKLVICTMMCGGLNFVCFAQKTAQKKPELSQKYLRGISALKKLVEKRDLFKKTIDTVEAEGIDVVEKKRKLEMLLKQVVYLFPGGDASLRDRIEKAIGRVQYLEQENEFIEKNYWRLSKPLIVFAVIAGVSLNVAFWFMMKYFLSMGEEISVGQDWNRRAISSIHYGITGVVMRNTQEA